MELPIKSILDSDLYKFTMQQAVLELFPNVDVTYRFKNRGKHRFTKDFLSILRESIQQMANLSLYDSEYLWLKEKIPFLKPWYLEYLKNYRFNPSQISTYLDREDDNLELSISGKWHSTILWEVPLMALISEIYFKEVDTNWEEDAESIELNARQKIEEMYMNKCLFSEFGTRRRRRYNVQDIVNNVFTKFQKEHQHPCFVGTSNVHLAMKYGIKAIGTMAHEWIMAMSVIESLRHANFYALKNWEKVYNADLGIALTDTFGTDSFFENFNKRHSKTYDGVRHDSGCPFDFTDKTITHYKNLGINPLSKFIIFSDSLNVNKAINIKKYCEDKINCSFGIGTHFTNDFQNSPALNMVIKLWSVYGVPVVKLGDGDGKEMGDKDAVRVAKWTMFGTPLDEQ